MYFFVWSHLRTIAVRIVVAWNIFFIIFSYRSKTIDNSDVESTTSSKASREHALKHPKLQGRVGDTLYIQLPNSETCALPYEPNLKISDLMERVCMKETYDSTDYFLILMVDDNKRHGLLDYTIPKEMALLDMFQYSSVKLCPKLIYDVTLDNPADYEHGSFGKCEHRWFPDFFHCIYLNGFMPFEISK